MAIEGGARAGLIAPDEKTFEYVKGRPHAPKGATWEAALAYWKTLKSDEGAHFDTVPRLDAAEIAPVVTWARLPRTSCRITGVVPSPEDFKGGKVDAARRSTRLHGSGARHPASGHRDRHGLHRLLHQRAHRGPSRGRPDHGGQEGQGGPPRHDSCRARASCGFRPKRRASPGNFRKQASNGAWPAARCALG